MLYTIHEYITNMYHVNICYVKVTYYVIFSFFFFDTVRTTTYASMLCNRII